MGFAEDFFGSEAFAKLPKKQVQTAIQTTNQGKGSRLSLAVKAASEAAAAYPAEVKRGGTGVLLNMIAGSLGLLPDVDVLKEEYEAPTPTTIKGKLKWTAGVPRRTISGLLVDKTELNETRSGISRTGRQLDQEITARMQQHEEQRRSEPALLAVATDFLGSRTVREVNELYNGTQFRSGPTSDPEKNLAVEIEANYADVDENTVGKVIRAQLREQFLGVAEAVVTKREHDSVGQVVKNPNAVVTTQQPDGSGQIVLIRQTPWQQLAAHLFGAGGWDGRSIAGGSTVYVGPDGKVYKKVGIENEVLANNLGDIIPNAHIQPEFRSAAQIADRKLNIPIISTVFEKLSTLGGLSKLNVPGMVELQRTGADERDYVTVTNVQRAFTRVASAVQAARNGLARLKQIEEQEPTVKASEDTFRAIQTQRLREGVIQLPRTTAVVEEARSIRSKRIENERKVFDQLGIKYPPEDTIVDSFTDPTEQERAAIEGLTGNHEAADVLISAFQRRKEARERRRQ